MDDIINVREPGLYTTIQDLGRRQSRSLGVPICGALDPQSMMVANLLVGNKENLPVLEITLQGPTLQFLDFGALALVGADLSPKLNDTPINNGETLFFSKGDVLSFGAALSGSRTYLAVVGGFDGESIVDSKSTHHGTQWGGFKGRPLKTGDTLSVSSKSPQRSRLKSNFKSYSDDQVLRIFPHLECHLIDRDLLSKETWKISIKSNRTGIRLEGSSITYDSSFEMISSPTDIGTVQLPPIGQPIVLLNDGAAVGGYLRVASIAKVDLPSLVQRKPGDSIRLQWIELAEATLLLKKRKRDFKVLVESIKRQS